MLLLLAAVGGASYLFIKVAVEEVEPSVMMVFRALILDERVRLAAVVGLAFILPRVVLGSGFMRIGRRAEVGASP